MAFTGASRKCPGLVISVPYGRAVTMLWCAGLKFVARLFEGRGPARAPEGSVVVRHQATGSELRFENEDDARRFLERHCCEPRAYDVSVEDESAGDRAA
jgi:hypothetical protein